MRVNRFFCPTLKENPAEAHVLSHRLMLRAGMICQGASGIYTWLPLGLRVLQKVQEIIRREHDRGGCLEVLMPTIQSADLWCTSGRYEDYGKEMLRIRDRHDREMLYGPTCEEHITDIFRRHVRSWRSLPLNLYQIQWKFRDEIRPRFGVMRGREFLMKDAYSFDLSLEDARQTYRSMARIYMRIFQAMGLQAVPVQADPGPIGGDMSHEFQILAETGESTLYYDTALTKTDWASAGEDDDITRRFYAAAEEKHDPACCTGRDIACSRGIEVGHIFYFGTKYSAPFQAAVADATGAPVTVHMGSYGIGVSRLVAALIEAHHDDKGICWPVSVAPFHVGLVAIEGKEPDKILQTCETLEASLARAGLEVLFDDRDVRGGIKFADMDLIGLPFQVIAGPARLASGEVDIRIRRTGEQYALPVEQVAEHLRQLVHAGLSC
jgi:prolyl-tRNA synthetase